MYEKISEIPIREEKIKKLKEKILADIDKHLERNRQDMKIFLTNNENIMQDWDFMISQEFTLLRLKDFIKNEYTFWSIEARYEEEDIIVYQVSDRDINIWLQDDYHFVNSFLSKIEL